MLRKVFLVGIVSLFAALPAQANEGKELRISGAVVRASTELVSVENRLGDAILTCRVPDRLAEKVAALKAGDKVRMICIRFKGRRAELRRLERMGDTPDAKKPEDQTTDEKRVEKQELAGVVAELGTGGIAVQGDAGRLACRVPAEKQAKLDGLKVGDKVNIYCLANVLVGLERATAPAPPAPPASGEEKRLYGKITGLSRDRVTVQGEAGSLSCFAPPAMAEKIAGRFAVGDSVKMMCRGSELTYLEKP